jgi:hypothetical protein
MREPLAKKVICPAGCAMEKKYYSSILRKTAINEKTIYREAEHPKGCEPKLFSSATCGQVQFYFLRQRDSH